MNRTQPQQDVAPAPVDTPRSRRRYRLEQELAAMKPHLRGWLHAGTYPAAVATGLVLLVLSPTLTARISTAIFVLSAVMLFGISALYHRFSWSVTSLSVLKRLDHANIFLIIAGTYTPFSVLLLPHGQCVLLLWLAWGGAVAGMAFRLIWTDAPRWLHVPVYLALGWVAVMFLPGFLRGGGVAVFSLILAGGLCYTLGGLVYGLKRPDPNPRWFGYHEVFHALTVAGYACHYVGLSLAVSSL